MKNDRAIEENRSVWRAELLVAVCGMAFIALMAFYVARAIWTQSGTEKTLSDGTVPVLAAAYETVSETETAEESAGPDLSDDPLLVLVNKTHALPADYTVELAETPSKGIDVDKRCLDTLLEMLADAKKEGLDLVVASGYRSPERQKEILEEDTANYMDDGLTYDEARDKALEQVMPPGYSEHETGLAVDIAAAYHQQLDAEQAMTAENRWLREHCAEYGFILRYPADKEAVTGIAYESWHFRYVGKEHAQAMTENGLTLEEYLGAAE